MTWLEIIALFVSVLGIVYTILEDRICWLINALASVLYLKVFYDSNLPGQLLLQILYIAVGVYGYLHWGKEDRIKLKRFGVWQTCVSIFASIGLGYIIYFLSADLLWADVSLTIGSFIATYLTAKKFLENWTLWIIINLVSVGLFLYRDLELTAVLYFAYMLLAVLGYWQWSKRLNRLAV